MISNVKVINYKILDLDQTYNFDETPFSSNLIWRRFFLFCCNMVITAGSWIKPLVKVFPLVCVLRTGGDDGMPLFYVTNRRS
jgi:hypothetical protein